MKSRKELINAILLHIEKDFLMFSDAELLEIYEDIIEMNY